MPRATLLWTLLAVCGVLLVAGVTLAASSLSTQTIGLSSEPPNAGDELSPDETPTATPQAGRGRATAAATRRERARRQRARREQARRDDDRAADPIATATVPPESSVTPTFEVDDDNSGSSGSGSDDDNSGSGSGDDSSGRGRGRGRGGDDDD